MCKDTRKKPGIGKTASLTISIINISIISFKVCLKLHCCKLKLVLYWTILVKHEVIQASSNSHLHLCLYYIAVEKTVLNI